MYLINPPVVVPPVVSVSVKFANAEFILTAPLTSSFEAGLVVPIPTFPLESIRIASAPPSANATVSAAGKKMPVLVSPVGEIAGAAAVPVPLVILVMDVRVGITPVVIVPVVLLSVATVPVVELRFVIVPVVIVAAVDVVVPNVPVSIVPVVTLAVGKVWAKLATVMRFRLFESEASPIKSVSLVAVIVSAVRS
jgi:hypothetical protein